MAEEPTDDDVAAVLRRLDQRTAGKAEGPLKAGVSLRAVTAIILMLVVVTLIIWAPWREKPHQQLVPTKKSVEDVLDPPPALDQHIGELSNSADSSNMPPIVDVESGGSAKEQLVIVNVVGHVAEPGVVSLPSGARVSDAIAAAGGPTAGADLTRVNLARIVADEDHIVILAADEQLPILIGPLGREPSHSSAGAKNSGPPESPMGTVLNLNAASASDLGTLPGIGPVLAERIIMWRQTNGGFRSVEDLRDVSGIGPKLFAQLAPLVSI